MRMWPFILLGIAVGTAMLPLIPEPALRSLTSVIYACVLAQRVFEKVMQHRAAQQKARAAGLQVASPADIDDQRRNSLELDPLMASTKWGRSQPSC